ncbi:DUF4148 domain-containing protein [Pelomonas sp. KK5]|uniref:DUF4148 domain-containing protein n=1 Tax=Pelomonas sp. KK5 TaxID=1855730 RepID=UPI00097C25D1|nr:DUF4148 domain-containing protein [Pelomonas sp. KK5]
MKTAIVFAAALLSAGVVFADAASADTGKTRAEVINELAQARASGELDALNADQSVLFQTQRAAAVNAAPVAKAAPAAGKTRAQVLAELREAQKSGELAALNSEDPMAIQRFAATQAAKKAEALAE